MLLYKSNHKGAKSIYNNVEFMNLSKKVSNQKIYFYLNVLNEAQNNMKSTNQKRTYLELALIKMSDYVEQISVDNSSAIIELEQKVKELENQIRQLKMAPVKEVVAAEITEEVVVQKRNEEFNYIESHMIGEVLNNGNVNKKKTLQSKISEIKSLKKERAITNTLEEANIVACSVDKAVITLPLTSQCDFLMRRENKNKLLALVNSGEVLIEDYYVIPQNIWDILLRDYTIQYKSGNKRPTLESVNIDVRLYNEEASTESEMQKIAYEFFGDIVNFE